MTKPRLLVLARELPQFQREIRNSLYSILSSRLENVEVNGSVALPFTPESLLNWAVLGENTSQDKFLGGIQKGCELYVGVRTPERNLGEKSEDGFNRYQLGERGFALARKKHIPAILLSQYDQDLVCEFVEKNL